ncbi:phage tail tube protein [Sphingomonas sanxanigenens]|uniref:Lambda phage tail tube protein N-terminal domain-containing protein n=1 Tax=Sphingomonas sanxanigenens DSM 19645 = NX02 TaxID=1123269 RepID=W0AIR4_9SPHN|nr:phage tail tube protein [Sphingomonas sanxanigenens]AHE55535.1 hypothetical protein NX02_19375 [Sphingomonas sanxanigenens DSM 19645 = NX02]
MAGETTGWGSEFHLANASGTLIELDGVFDMGIPEETVSEVEKTHYKSPQKRREYIGGLIDTGTFSIQMNYVPGSATDAACREARGKVREFMTRLPDEDGEPAWEISGTVLVLGYQRAIPLDDRLTATLNVRVTGAVDEDAAVVTP